MDESAVESNVVEELNNVLEAEERTEKNYHIREAIQLLNLVEDD